jgi:UDP-glucose 4-epimerase
VNPPVRTSEIDHVVILGHSGFIGSHLVRTFRGCPGFPEVVCLDLPALDLTVPGHARTLADVFEPTAAIVMCSGVKRQLGDTLDTFAQNLAMVVNVCRVLEECAVRRFVYFSSAAVYGEETTNVEITEETPVDPTSRYGIAKFTSERLLRRALGAHKGSSLVLLRPPLAYGPGDLGFYGPSGFVHSALREGTITLWGEGDELREFVFVEDLAELVARFVLTEYSGVANTVRGESYTFRHAAEIASGLVPGTKIEIRPRSRPKADHAFRGDLIRRLFPDFVFTPLEEGMRRTLGSLEHVASE